MSPSSSSFVNPASLHAPSPSPSLDDGKRSPSPEAPSTQPPRKRARSDISAEERREARAHRNRIAAQNSRDRRKLQFSSLSARVAELEEENRRLRQELSKYTSAAPQAVQATATDTRDEENEELRERVRTLERSWESVVRMLAAQGTAQPVDIPSSPSLSASPAPSSITLSADVLSEESTRHLAAGGSEAPSNDSASPIDKIILNNINSDLANHDNNVNAPLSLNTASIVPFSAGASGTGNASVEDWFMDIMSTSPAETHFPIAAATLSQATPGETPAAVALLGAAATPAAFDWECGAAEVEMQRLLALLPPPDDAREDLATLGLDVCETSGWAEAIGAF